MYKPGISFKRFHHSRWMRISLFALLSFMLLCGNAFGKSQEEILRNNREILDGILQRVPPGQDTIMIDDMIFSVEDLSTKSSFTGTPWTGGRVYYTFDSGVTEANRTNFRDAANEWAMTPSLIFIEDGNRTNHILVKNGSSNSSWVGMVGGSQSLTIYNWGYKFIIAHEIGHALGLTHEHQRSDQADFINILEANIDSNICDAGCIASNFHLESTTDLTTYDFSSVMHYAKDAFAKPGLNTIEPKPAYSDFLDSMGQRTHLSNPDKQGMLTRYSSPVPSLTSLGVVILSILIALTGWLLYRKAKRPVSL